MLQAHFGYLLVPHFIAGIYRFGENYILQKKCVQYIHGHYASIVMLRKKLQTMSETTSALLYILHNH